MTPAFQKLLASARNCEEGVLSEEQFRKDCADYLSGEENLIENMLFLLQAERRKKAEFKSEVNEELSRALVALESFGGNRKREKQFRQEAVDKVKAFYIKWRHFVVCNFKIKGLD